MLKFTLEIESNVRIAVPPVILGTVLETGSKIQSNYLYCVGSNLYDGTGYPCAGQSKVALELILVFDSNSFVVLPPVFLGIVLETGSTKTDVTF